MVRSGPAGELPGGSGDAQNHLMHQWLAARLRRRRESPLPWGRPSRPAC